MTSVFVETRLYTDDYCYLDGLFVRLKVLIWSGWSGNPSARRKLV